MTKSARKKMGTGFVLRQVFDAIGHDGLTPWYERSVLQKSIVPKIKGVYSAYILPADKLKGNSPGYIFPTISFTDP